MLRMTLAATALAITAPVLADETCLKDARGAQCDVFLDQYRANDVPVGTTDMWASDEFVMESLDDQRSDNGVNLPGRDDVLYWDGDSAMVVPKQAGPRLEIADW